MTTATTTDSPSCSVRAIHKHYGGIAALDGVDLEFRAGEVHAIIGENGAGKSTLMKILAGAVRPDRGELLRRGTAITPTSVAEANRHGIAIVFQELSLFPALDVLANLFRLREPRRLGLISRASMRAQAATVLGEVGLNVELTQPVGELSLGEQQLVEIAKGLLTESDVLILDEPNSALNATESQILFELVGRLRDRGVAILYVSQRLEEVFQVSDVITIMRSGRVVETIGTQRTTMRHVVHQMIGREPAEIAAPHHPLSPSATHDGGVILNQLCAPGVLIDVDLSVAPGEVVGVAGLDGSGASELLEVLFGLRASTSGTVRMPTGGRPRAPAAAVRAGVAYVPADRRTQGLMLEQSCLANLSHVSAGVLGRSGYAPRRSPLVAAAASTVDMLQIKLPALDAPVRELSGGNQQKVVLGKWLQANPRVVLLHDPTRGVDVGAKASIYLLIRQLAEDGRVVLFTTSELLEYPLVCDRVLIFYRGRLVGEIRGNDMTEHNLLRAVNTGEVVDSTGPEVDAQIPAPS